MSAVTESSEENLSFDPQFVQEKVAQATIDCMKDVVSVLIVSQSMTPKQLIAERVTPQLLDELGSLDELVGRVFYKLLGATKEQMMQGPSQALFVSIFANLQAVTGSDETGPLFLKSFVLPRAQTLTNELCDEQPEALESVKIWV